MIILDALYRCYLTSGEVRVRVRDGGWRMLQISSTLTNLQSKLKPNCA